VLLDSHVLLWWMEDSPRLGPLVLPDSFQHDVVRSGLAELLTTAAHAQAMLS
jgi:hypothetical protein